MTVCSVLVFAFAFELLYFTCFGSGCLLFAVEFELVSYVLLVLFAAFLSLQCCLKSATPSGVWGQYLSKSQVPRPRSQVPGVQVPEFRVQNPEPDISMLFILGGGVVGVGYMGLVYAWL